MPRYAGNATLENFGFRDARPDPEPGGSLISASPSVLEAYRYRAVIECLAKDESLIFLVEAPQIFVNFRILTLR